MSFYSEYAPKIWDKLYTVNIPDQVTLNPDYINKFGVHITTDKNINEMISTNFITVMIPVIKILEYFINGIEIQIPSRDDMITMHKDIEGYLNEWYSYTRSSVHGLAEFDQNKQLISSLEKLSKYIFNKASPTEVLDNLFVENKLGLMDPITEQSKKNNITDKPDYTSIFSLVKGNSGSRF